MKPAVKRPKSAVEVLQNGALGLLKTQIRMVKAAQANHGGDLDELKKLTDAAGGLARSLAAILAEQRKQEAALKVAIDHMTNDERVELVGAFLEELPIEHRALIAEKLVALGGGLL
jgi:hypothetical protein